MPRNPDHIGTLRDHLLRYACEYPAERAVVEQFLSLAAAGRGAFFRDHSPGHFTASAVVVDAVAEWVLLTHHRKLGIWIQLGGHADGVTDLLQAALKEAEEESGISEFSVPFPDGRILDVDIHPIPAIASEPAHLHYDVRYLLIAARSDTLTVSDESHDVKWVRTARLADYSDEESLHRAVTKALQLIRPKGD